MASFINSKHDIGLLRQAPLATTNVGLMLAKDKNGAPRYRRYDDDPLSEQRATGTAGYGWFPPGKELPIILDDFSEGISREVYDSSAPGKYFKALNMDCRFGTPIAGLKAGTLTKPTSTAPTILNADFEAFTGAVPDDWTVESGTTADEEGTVHGDSHSCLLSDGAADTIIYQDLATTQIQGRRFTVTAWLHVSVASKGKFGVDDGVTISWSDWHTGVEGWEQLKVIKTLSTTADKLRIKVHGEQGTGVYVDDIAITRATLGTTTSDVKYGTDHYLNFGGLLAKIQNSDGTIIGVYEFPSPIPSLTLSSDGLLFVGQESEGHVIEDCEDVWDESKDADATVTLDTGDYKVGSGSVKFVIASGMGVNTIVATEVVSLDAEEWSTYDGVEMWIKCSVATSSGDLQLLLDNTADCGSPLETLNIPALTADKWERVHLNLASNDNTEDIISVGLKYITDLGACTIWVDSIEGEYRYQSIGLSGNPTKVGAGDVGVDGYADHMILIGTTMWKEVPPNNLYSSTDPSDATGWSTVTTVDSANTNIIHLVARRNALYIMKEDRPYYLDSNGAVQVLVDDTVTIQTSDSGEDSFVWHGNIYMPWGSASLLYYDGTTTDWIEPALYCVNLGDFDGQIQGLAGDEQFLYAIVDNATKVEVMAGQWVGSNFIWHGSLAELTLTGCRHAFISNAYKKRLYIASTDASENFTYYNLYANYGDVTNDANRNFPDGGELHTPWLHGNFKGDTKAYIKITLTMEDTSSTVYFEGHYRKLGQSWAQGADIGDFKTSPTTVKYIPVDAGSLKPKSPMMQFKFVEKTGSATSTPKLINIDIRAILYVTKRRIIECVVRGCDAPLNRQKMGDAISASHISTVLIEADNATWPVTFYPWGWQGSSDTVYVNFLSCDEVVEIDEESRKPEVHWYLRLLEVSLS